MTACKNHRQNPAIGYRECPGCEIEALQAEARELALSSGNPIAEVVAENRELVRDRDAAEYEARALRETVTNLRAELARVREAGEIMARKLDELGVPVPDLDLARRGILSQPDERPASPDSALPLIAWRQGMPQRPAKDIWHVGGKSYLVADIDEHGLPVIERTADMADRARYRSKQIGSDGWVYHAKYAGADGYDWQRIEDYNAHAEPAQREGE